MQIGNCLDWKGLPFAKCSYFILSTKNIKFYWFVMKIKKFLLPIWWHNRGLFPLGNKFLGVFILNGLTYSTSQQQKLFHPLQTTSFHALYMKSGKLSCVTNLQGTKMPNLWIFHHSHIPLHHTCSHFFLMHHMDLYLTSSHSLYVILHCMGNVSKLILFSV